MRIFYLLFLLLSLTNVKDEDMLFSLTIENSKSLKLIDKTGRIVFDKSLNCTPFDRIYYKKGNFIIMNNEKWLIYNKSCELVKEYLISDNSLYFSNDSNFLFLLMNTKRMVLPNEVIQLDLAILIPSIYLLSVTPKDKRTQRIIKIQKN